MRSEDEKKETAQAPQDTAEAASAPQSAQEKPAKSGKEKKSKKKSADKSAAELEKLQKELDETKEQMMRVAAEYANYRSRTAKEKESAFSNAKCTVVSEFLAVADNLERAVTSGQNDLESLHKGLTMTLDGLKAALEKLGVSAYGENGDTFDPNLHNAVMHIEDEQYGDGEIVDVFQKGYKINDKVIRPAMVKVAN
ncbi:MAG: nucleotide exchange factor GrpE [Clostridiales bacterium]|nr:nucleotide exchange factor GrpE [Clostridiales bacterium]